MSRDDGPWDDDALVSTTETREGIRGRILMALLLGGIVVIMNLTPRPPRLPQIGEWRYVYDLIGVDVAMVALMVGIMVLFARGTWIIDRDGITHEPCHGRPRRILWSEVEAVNINRRDWTIQGGWAIRGSGRTMIVSVGVLGGVVEARLRKILSADFDLDAPIPIPAPDPRQARRRVARLLAACFLVAIPGVVGAFVAAERWPEWKAAQSATIFTPLLFVLLFGFYVIGRERHECRRVHPAWPWRLRRTKAKLATDEWHAMWYP